MIRKASVEDVPSILLLDAKVLKTNWNERLYSESTAMEDTYFNVAEVDHELVGFHMYRNIGGDFEILQIAVDPQQQNQGLGSKFMETMVNHAITIGIENIFLEVRVDNAKAIQFYERFGFQRIHVRKNYYGPQEDGLVMKREC